MRQQSKPTPNRPDYRVTYKAGEDDFREIGAAWHRKDGNGLFLRLNGMPFDSWDGSLSLFPIETD